MIDGYFEDASSPGADSRFQIELLEDLELVLKPRQEICSTSAENAGSSRVLMG